MWALFVCAAARLTAAEEPAITYLSFNDASRELRIEGANLGTGVPQVTFDGIVLPGGTRPAEDVVVFTLPAAPAAGSYAVSLLARGKNGKLSAENSAVLATITLGAVGPQGLKGDKGDRGEIGAQGPAGPRGETGAAGAAGAQGPTGQTGATGAQGPQGPQGAAGPQGIMGPQGPVGPQGVPGVAGPMGPQGAEGAVGPQGPAGAQGVTGPQGPIGPQGPAGPVAGEKVYAVVGRVTTFRPPVGELTTVAATGPASLQVVGFKLAVASTFSLGGSTGGAGAGKAQRPVCEVTFAESAFMPQFFQWLVAGAALKSLTFEFPLPDGVTLRLTLGGSSEDEAVGITKFNATTAANGTPLHEVAFATTTMSAEYRKSGGTRDTVHRIEWDFIANAGITPEIPRDPTIPSAVTAEDALLYHLKPAGVAFENAYNLGTSGAGGGKATFGAVRFAGPVGLSSLEMFRRLLLGSTIGLARKQSGGVQMTFHQILFPRLEWSTDASGQFRQVVDLVNVAVEVRNVGALGGSGLLDVATWNLSTGSSQL